MVTNLDNYMIYFDLSAIHGLICPKCLTVSGYSPGEHLIFQCKLFPLWVMPIMMVWFSAGDYACVQANFGNGGNPGGSLLGDANHDGVVSAGDYACVQANFGNSSFYSVIPEPVDNELTGFGGLFLCLSSKTE